MQKISALFAIGLCAFGTVASVPAYSAPLFSEAVVVLEKDDQENLDCNASTGEAGEAVKQVLRKSGSRIIAEPQPGVPAAWVSVSAIDLGGRCAVSFSLQMFLVQPLAFPRGMIVEAPGEYCLLGGLMEWSKAGLQRELNDKLEGLAEDCMRKVEARLGRGTPAASSRDR